MRRDDQLENTFEEGFAYADPELLEILEIPMVYGSPAHALAKPNTIVLAKSKADKYFPNEDPVGKTIILNDDKSQPFTVGGVMEDFPRTSHLQFDFFITLTGKEFWQGEQTSWCCWNYNPYIKVRPGTDPAELEKKLLAMKNIYIDYLAKEGNQSVNDVRKYLFFVLQPVRDIHLFSADIGDAIEHGDIRYIWLFGGIACFILALACINFINLSTAKSANRAKEVGLRKVVGSVRSHLVRQFLTESVIFSMVSFVLAVFLVWIGLPYFNDLAGKAHSIPWGAWWLFPLLTASALFIGVLAGIYPAFYLSSFKPIDVLKGSIARGSKTSGMRSVMVVFQFTTSIVLIIGTFIIYRQMDFILNKKIGYDKDQVVMLQGANTLGKQQQTFKDELLRLSGVQHVTVSQYFPVDGTTRDQNMFYRDGKSQEEKGFGAQRWYVDEDYLSTLAWYMMQKWLQDYKYRTEITWDVFAISGFLAVFIALLTVSYQSIRAALANPANNLRSE
ncbi:MAG: ABC transporter permease [Cyclobacteriaceae bacterium]